MDITIKINGYRRSEAMKKSAENKLTKKYGSYPFISKLILKLFSEDEKMHNASIECRLSKQQPIFATASSKISSGDAFTLARKKIEKQIEKYKEVHYKGSHRNGSNLN